MDDADLFLGRRTEALTLPAGICKTRFPGSKSAPLERGLHSSIGALFPVLSAREKDRNVLFVRKRSGEAAAVALDWELACPAAAPAMQPAPKPAAAAKSRRKT